MSSTSSTDMIGTKTPRLRSETSRPCSVKRLRASRTGPRPTRNAAAMEGSVICSPGAKRPLASMSRSRLATVSAMSTGSMGVMSASEVLVVIQLSSYRHKTDIVNRLQFTSNKHGCLAPPPDLTEENDEQQRACSTGERIDVRYR